MYKHMLFFKRKQKEDNNDLKELKENIEWTINAFGFFNFERKELIHSLLREIINKESFTEEDIDRYKKYLIENRLIFEEFEKDIERKTEEKKYCKCGVENGKIRCDIDERILKGIIKIDNKNDIILDKSGAKEFYNSLFALMAILYTYKDILLKIQNGEIKELKEKLLKDSDILSILN